MKTYNLFKVLGIYLKAKRQSANLKQLEVARILGYSSAQFISNFERGLCSPPLGKLRILMDLYKIPLEEMTSILLQQQRNYIEFHLSKTPSGRRKKVLKLQAGSKRSYG